MSFDFEKVPQTVRDFANEILKNLPKPHSSYVSFGDTLEDLPGLTYYWQLRQSPLKCVELVIWSDSTLVLAYNEKMFSQDFPEPVDINEVLACINEHM